MGFSSAAEAQTNGIILLVHELFTAKVMNPSMGVVKVSLRREPIDLCTGCIYHAENR